MIYHNLKKTDPKQTFNLPSIDKNTIITCIHCGAEYLAGEVFMPGALIGQPRGGVVKDSLGKIICVDYPAEAEPIKTEAFVCEYCNKPFVVEANVTYKSLAEDPAKDFENPYVSLID